jgi:hypothetical protein
VRKAEVDYKNGTYRLLFVVELDAGRDGVLGVVTDFNRLYRLSPAIVESLRLPPRVVDLERRLLAIRGCVLIFCRKVVLIEDVERIGTDTIVTTIDPAESDFRAGRTEWQVTDAGNGHCRIRLESSITPDFWVPPLIGPAIIKRKLLSEARETLIRIEALANGE